MAQEITKLRMDTSIQHNYKERNDREHLNFLQYKLTTFQF